MKPLLLVSTLLLVSSQAWAESGLMLGASVQMEPSIYKGGKDRVLISPFKLDRDGFYLSGPSLNVYKSPVSRAYVGVGLDEWDHKRGKSDITAGMNGLDRAINLRTGAAWKIRAGVFNVDLAHDFNAHKGNQARVRYTKPIQGARVLWLPYASVQWLDKDVSNYYFGVKSTEATTTRPTYQLNSTQVLKAGVDAEFPVSRNVAMVTGVGVTAYDSDIKNSSLVDKGSAPYVKVGLAYRFR
jgi:outer membrane protein